MINKLYVAGLAIVALAAVAFTSPKTTSYVADATKSTIGWSAKKVTGAHNGKVKLASGNLSYDGKTLSAGSFEIDLASLTVEDLTDATWNGKLVGHLKSDDFFSTEKHPKATFKLTKSAAKGAGVFDVTGDLTIKGITHPVTFPATLKVTGKELVAVAQITVDRTKYDIKYGSNSFFDNLGDKAIENNFTIDLHLVAHTK